MDILQTIYGIGPVLARKLIKQLTAQGYIKPDRTYSKSEIYKILKTHDIWDTLPEAAKAYLTYLPDRKIPRAIIEVLENELHKHIQRQPIIIAGSYRRGKSTSNDADIVAIQTGDVLARIEQGIAKSKVVKMLPPYAIGPDRISIMFRVRVNRDKLGVKKSKYTVKSDVFICDRSEYIFMLLYATGSGSFNIMMRAQAKRRGFLLNQHGLYDKFGVSVQVKKEREIFDIIGVTYREPSGREL